MCGSSSSIADGYDEYNFMGSVRVIEIAADMDLGINNCPAKYLPASRDASGTYIEDYCRKMGNSINTYTMSDDFNKSGYSKIKIENTSNLLIYSKNGAKLTHAGFSVLSCDNVVFRNIEMDEMWQWEDSKSTSAAKIGDYDAFGWAYFKISECGNIWIDHCTFGKSYDGQIDVSNPVYNSKGTVFRAPYGADGTSAVHISWCNFNAGSDSPSGYIYQMMSKIEADYQAGNGNYQYYKSLRDAGATFEQILYGIAIPQKKAFLLGDSSDEFFYNESLRVSIGNCKFTNVEDRIPKMRGGVAYMYNTVVDNSQYYKYRAELKALNAQNVVQRVNPKWKCGLVSQLIVCGNGGDVAIKNCIVYGVATPLKNNDSTYKNDSKYEGATYDGGYNIQNSIYKDYRDSSSSQFVNATPSTLTEANFDFKTEDNNPPFEVLELDLDKLEQSLLDSSFGSGTKKKFVNDWLNFAE